MDSFLVPRITAQESAREVINDVANGSIAKDSFWISWNDKECVVDVYKNNGKLELRSLGDTNICASNSQSDQLSKVNVLKGSGSLYYIDISDSQNQEFYRIYFNTGKFFKFNGDFNENITTIDAFEDKMLIGDSSGGLFYVSITEDGAIRQKFSGHLMHTAKCRFFPSGKVALSAGSDFQLKIWDVFTGENPRSLKYRSQVTDFDFIGKGRNIVAGYENGIVIMWECGSGGIVYEFDCKLPVVAVKVLGQQTSSLSSTGMSATQDEFETQNKILIAATKSRILAWDMQTKELKYEIITSNTTHIDVWMENIIVSGTEFGQVHFWNVSDGTMAQQSLSVDQGNEVNGISTFDNELVVITGSQAFALVNGRLAQTYLITDDSVPLQCVCASNTGIYVGGKSSYIRRFNI